MYIQISCEFAIECGCMHYCSLWWECSIKGGMHTIPQRSTSEWATPGPVHSRWLQLAVAQADRMSLLALGKDSRHKSLLMLDGLGPQAIAWSGEPALDAYHSSVWSVYIDRPCCLSLVYSFCHLLNCCLVLQNSSSKNNRSYRVKGCLGLLCQLDSDYSCWLSLKSRNATQTFTFLSCV